MYRASRTLRLAATILVGGTLLAAPTEAAADSSAVKGAVSQLTGGDATGSPWTFSTEPLSKSQLKTAQQQSEMSTKGSKHIPSANWRACAWNAKTTKKVHDYVRIRVRGGGNMIGSTAALECGNSKFGYKHILAHRKDWETKAWYIQRNWRDLAGYSIHHILRDPDKVTYNKHADTWCWSRAIFLYHGKKHVDTMYPHVALGNKGRRIVSAFPSGHQCTGKKLYPH